MVDQDTTVGMESLKLVDINNILFLPFFIHFVLMLCKLSDVE